MAQERQKDVSLPPLDVEEGAIWAHSLPRPERGAVLLAHPLMFEQSQQYFHQAVILLLDHDSTGSYGVILNRPSDYKMGQLILAEGRVLLEPFEDCRCAGYVSSWLFEARRKAKSYDLQAVRGG